MSSSVEEQQADELCASCGKAAVDDVKLKICTACKLVKYCSVECQKNHRPQHKKACKKRAAEIRDDALFTQPAISHLGECPICFLPLPLDVQTLMPCCSKSICDGCLFANVMSNITDKIKAGSCMLCREQPTWSKNDYTERVKKRAEANDPVAIRRMGGERFSEGDYDSAFEYLTKAAELGDIESHFLIGNMYHGVKHEFESMHKKGEGVEKDEKKAVYYYEKAAIGGHPDARHNLAVIDQGNGNYERAVKHLVIAAKLGSDKSLDMVKAFHRYGKASKEDFEAALRGHQAAVDAMKSEQREAAKRAGTKRIDPLLGLKY